MNAPLTSKCKGLLVRFKIWDWIVCKLECLYVLCEGGVLNGLKRSSCVRVIVLVFVTLDLRECFVILLWKVVLRLYEEFLDGKTLDLWTDGFMC